MHFRLITIEHMVLSIVGAGDFKRMGWIIVQLLVFKVQIDNIETEAVDTLVQPEFHHPTNRLLNLWIAPV